MLRTKGYYVEADMRVLLTLGTAAGDFAGGRRAEPPQDFDVPVADAVRAQGIQGDREHADLVAARLPGRAECQALVKSAAVTDNSLEAL